MINANDEQFLWCQKYRPNKIEECILPESIKSMFQQYVTAGDIPNFVLSGTAGAGKTTVAKALCEELKFDYIMINGSDEGRKIDILRTVVKGFASTVSLSGSKKVVIIDEADYMSAEHVQPALRNMIEEFSANCRFIFTCNYKYRLIEPLLSRCSVIEFKIEAKDKQQIAAKFFKRVTQILEIEGVTFEPKAVAELISTHFPDYRRILNELQRYSSSGNIDSGVLVNFTEDSFKTLIKQLKEKNFSDMRKWVNNNSDDDIDVIFDRLFDTSQEYMEPASIPQLVLTLAEYQYKSAFVANQKINMTAAFTEIMMNCKFL